MKITKKFLQLTKKTYPHGTESQLKNQLPQGYQIDKWGNYFIEVGKESTTMFTCHLDTASYSESKVNHVFENNLIKTDGKSILGADDKAGMVVLLYMIKNRVPGIYYFFLGEERGCIGSSDVASNWSSLPFSERITKVVSFDRRGTTSVITEQFGGVCCSDTFAQELATRLNQLDDTFKFRPDPTGIYTDSAQFIDIVQECTNISVGYYSEHTHHEAQDIEFLKKLCKAVVKLDWETLPIDRDFRKKSRSDYFHSPTDDWYDYWNNRGPVPTTEFKEPDLKSENKLISDFLILMGVQCDEFSWNGHSLHVINGNKEEFIATRQEILEFIPDLDDRLNY